MIYDNAQKSIGYPVSLHKHCLISSEANLKGGEARLIKNVDKHKKEKRSSVKLRLFITLQKKWEN